MHITKLFKKTVIRKLKDDAEFRVAMVEEAANNLLDGDIQTAFSQLRDIVKATTGFARLSEATGIPKPRLKRMLGNEGNPRVKDFSAILNEVARGAGASISVCVVPASR